MIFLYQSALDLNSFYSTAYDVMIKCLKAFAKFIFESFFLALVLLSSMATN